MSVLTVAYKAFTHNLCSPIQGGEPIWDGALPFSLPSVIMDKSDKKCSYGWNAARDPKTVIQIAGLCPGGWPVRLYCVETKGKVIERGDKLRASTWRIVKEIPVQPVIESFSQEAFSAQHTKIMSKEQIAWYQALGRPQWSLSKVIRGLETSLKARGLNWTLQRFESAGAVWTFRAAAPIWPTNNAWNIVTTETGLHCLNKDTREATKKIRNTWFPWPTCNIQTSWAAGDAWAALLVQYAARNNWISHRPDLLTVGLRSAYRHGLAIALPVGADTLGWAMI